MYKQLVPVWSEAKAETVAAKAEVAWTWWQASKSRYENTKLWRLIESLAGLRSASLIPKRGFVDILMGCICVTRSRATTLRYSFYRGNDGESEHPQVREAVNNVFRCICSRVCAFLRILYDAFTQGG